MVQAAVLKGVCSVTTIVKATCHISDKHVPGSSSSHSHPGPVCEFVDQD